MVAGRLAVLRELLPPKRPEGHAHFAARAGGRAMNLPVEFSAMPGKTLFMAAADSWAVIVTRSGKKFRQRARQFSDEHAALNWCLKRRATFVLLPHRADPKLN